jgi:hypothetical protein
MFLMSEEEMMATLNEGIGIRWNVFSNFGGSSDEVDDLKNELQKANRYYRGISDEKLVKDRNGFVKVITAIFRVLLDLEGIADVLVAPLTLGLTLITYLFTRVLSLPLDATEQRFYEKEAEKAIDKLKELKKKNPKEADEIDRHIRRIENALDDLD